MFSINLCLVAESRNLLLSGEWDCWSMLQFNNWNGGFRVWGGLLHAELLSFGFNLCCDFGGKMILSTNWIIDVVPVWWVNWIYRQATLLCIVYIRILKTRWDYTYCLMIKEFWNGCWRIYRVVAHCGLYRIFLSQTKGWMVKFQIYHDYSFFSDSFW